MKRVQRLRKAIAANVKNAKFEDLERLLEAAGFEKRQPRGGSSHYTFKRGAERVTVPKHKPVNTVYVEQVLDLIPEEPI